MFYHFLESEEMNALRVINFFLFVFIALVGIRVAYLALSEDEMFFTSKIQHDCVQLLFLVSGVGRSAVFPFNRWIFAFVSTSIEDGAFTIPLSIPSLQPNRNHTIPLRLYVPKQPKMLDDGTIPLVVWLHGGGFVFGSFKDEPNHSIVSLLTEESGFYYLAVDYSLAPEHKFPDAIEDCYSVLYYLNEDKADWLHSSGEYSRLPPVSLKSIFIGGIGSGGHLAMHSMLLWKDREEGASRLRQAEFHPHHHFYSNPKMKVKGSMSVSADMMEYPLTEEYMKEQYILTYQTNEYLRDCYLLDHVDREEQMNHLYIGMVNNLEEEYDEHMFWFSYKESLFAKQTDTLIAYGEEHGIQNRGAVYYYFPLGSFATRPKYFRFLLGTVEYMIDLHFNKIF